MINNFISFLIIFLFFNHKILANRHDIPCIKPTQQLTINQEDNQCTNHNNFTIGIMTWNLGEKSPTLKDCQFLKSFHNKDLIVLGIQECEDIKPRRNEGSRSKRWKELQQKLLGKNYKKLISHKLGGMQLSIFGNNYIRKQLRGIESLEIPCGVGNLLSNKGAICFILKIFDKKIAIINAHFAAHDKKVIERNANYKRVVSVIQNSVFKRNRNTEDSIVSNHFNDNLSELFDGIVFLGDLNYRLDIPKLEVQLFCEKYCIKDNKSTKLPDKLATPSRLHFREEKISDCLADLVGLLQHDQLKNQMLRKKSFSNFKEFPIRFPPTYKYNKRSSIFDTSKKARRPAWTDRILYASKDNNLDVVDYYSLDSRTSDHRPVCAEAIFRNN